MPSGYWVLHLPLSLPNSSVTYPPASRSSAISVATCVCVRMCGEYVCFPFIWAKRRMILLGCSCAIDAHICCKLVFWSISSVCVLRASAVVNWCTNQLEPNSSLITIKVIPSYNVQPEKANCRVCTLPPKHFLKLCFWTIKRQRLPHGYRCKRKPLSFSFVLYPTSKDANSALRRDARKTGCRLEVVLIQHTKPQMILRTC